MKKVYLIIAVALAVIFMVFFLILLPKRNNTSGGPVPTPQSPTASVFALETKINSDGPVAVKVTPKFSSEITFEITLDTHSEELSADLIQAAMLKDENGKEYKPLHWEGDPPGGHHRNGILTFGSIAPTPQTFKLTIQKIGGIAEREFLWIINP